MRQWNSVHKLSVPVQPHPGLRTSNDTPLISPCSKNLECKQRAACASTERPGWGAPQVREKVAAGAVTLDKFVVVKQLTKRPEDYPDAKNQPHVQVALRRRAAHKRDGTMQVLRAPGNPAR